MSRFVGRKKELERLLDMADKKTASLAPGCQIDYMIQTRFNTVYVCEIKFSQAPVGVSVISDVQKKVDAIKFPKRFSTRAVLLHVNGVTVDLIDSDYFAAIIDLGALLA